jgi:hypothetical protein
MLRDLDETLRALLSAGAEPRSLLATAGIDFEIPDAHWRNAISRLTVNCYLYDIRENRELRTAQPISIRSEDGRGGSSVPPPVRVDCAYCLTAWSPALTEAALEEHRLLSQVLLVLLRNPRIPKTALKGSLAAQPVPYPLVLASQEGVKNQAQFWQALDQRLKPSLNYVVTLAIVLGPEPAAATIPTQIKVKVDDRSLAPKPGAPEGTPQ